MSSSFNSRTRPAEVLLTEAGDLRLIRQRQTFEDLLAGQIDVVAEAPAESAG